MPQAFPPKWPNLRKSMPATDFISVFGRLLREGALRDAFAADPRAVADNMGLGESDHLALLRLCPNDLEFQARVLINKRFDTVRKMLPETCVLLGENARPAFHRYAREYWPSIENQTVDDADKFCAFLDRQFPVGFRKAEWNRVRFARSGARLALHWVRRTSPGNASCPAVQILFRIRAGAWREIFLYIKI